MTVVWYGIPIECSTYYTYVYADVRQGSILTPVLPYRTTIKEDGKLEAFYRFVRNKVAGYCIDYINDPEKNDEITDLKIMETMESIATQDEMDMLKRFYVHVDEPHYPVEFWNSHSKSKRIIHMNESSPVNEIVSSVAIKGLEDAKDKRQIDQKKTQNVSFCRKEPLRPYLCPINIHPGSR